MCSTKEQKNTVPYTAGRFPYILFDMSEPTIHEKRWWYREDVLLLLLLGVLFLLPGLHRIPLFDRDEPRFAAAARTMYETHDFIVPYFNGQLRPDKPPLVYWLMDLGYWATGGPGELGARLPSVICGTLTLVVVYFMVGARFGRITGFLSALLFGSCPLFLAEARMSTADGTMLLGIAVAMACAWQAWDGGGVTAWAIDGARVPRADFLPDRSGDGTSMLLDNLPTAPRRRTSLGMAMLFWVALGWGAMAKGVPLAFVLVPMMVLSVTTGAKRYGPWGALGMNWGWWRQLRPLMGVPLLVVLVGWWVVLAGEATHWKLIEDMVGTHFLNRIGIPTPDHTPGGTHDAMKAYKQWPGFYVLMIWATFWPWSILLVPTGYHTWRRLRGKTAIAIDRRPYQFLVAWIIPMWIGLELARGKLFHYPLPLYMPLAILCADMLVQSWNRLTDVLEAKWFDTARWVTGGIWVVLGVLVLVWAKVATDPQWFWGHFGGVAQMLKLQHWTAFDPQLVWSSVPLAVALMATGVVNVVTWGKHSWPYVLALCWGGSMLLANTIMLPEMPELQVSRIAGREMKALVEKDGKLELGVCDYEDATLVFYSGRNVRRFGSVDELVRGGSI